AEHAAIRRREGVRGVCLLKLPNASLGFLGAPSLLVRLSLRFREKTLKPVNLTGKQIDPGVADAVVGVYGFGDVLCDRLSGTKGKLRRPTNVPRDDTDTDEITDIEDVLRGQLLADSGIQDPPELPVKSLQWLRS